MDLIERYLNEIGRRLPKAKRDDIRSELRSALDDALESRAGTEPSEDDLIAVLEEFGPPETVAASYSGDRYLIGPRLYPQFKTTLRVVVTVLAGLVVVGFALSTLGGTLGLVGLVGRLGDLISSLLDSALTSVGIVVVVFALLERLDVWDELPAKRWDPRKLPAVRDVDLVGRFDSIAGIVFTAVFLIVINQFSDRIGIVVLPGGKLLLNDVFRDNLPWLNTSLLLPMGLSVWLFWSGRWHWSSRILKIGFDLFGLFVVHRICQSTIAARGEVLAAGVPAGAVAVLVRIAELAPVFVALLVLAGAGKHLYRGYKSLV